MTPTVRRATLQVDGDAPGLVGVGVCVAGLESGHMLALRSYISGGGALQALLRLSVVQPPPPRYDELPGMAGRHLLLDAGLRFLPAFPFERGTLYRAHFRPRGVQGLEDLEDLTAEVFFKAEPGPAALRVEAMFPSGDELPANLLRFYVLFSNPMQRGWAVANITIVDADGREVPDVLYNAPVELWDRSMQRLTVLLDPGRLKRGVGPNRELGPPLVAGRPYTLAIGPGMTDASGGQLPEAVRKPFRVTEAVRAPIAIDRWRVSAPEAGGREPLALGFEGALDWGLLFHAIIVETADGRRIDGRIAIGDREQQWRFTPTAPWIAGPYQARVSSGLEDVCGNTVEAPFDRPLRSEAEVGQARGPPVRRFEIA